MAVITISREYASGGDEVASRLCEVLGYRSFGKRQILDAARQTNLSQINAIDYTEDNHEVQNFLDRLLLGQTASPVQRIAWSENPSIAPRPDQADVKETEVIRLVQRAVQVALRDNNMVIVGRGGQVLLQDSPGVIHVRVEAPIELRFKNVIEQMRNEQGDTRPLEELRRSAGDLIANRDVASADYVKRYYQVDWADPQLYHMVLNLGKLSVEQAVQMIVALVQNINRK